MTTTAAPASMLVSVPFAPNPWMMMAEFIPCYLGGSSLRIDLLDFGLYTAPPILLFCFPGGPGYINGGVIRLSILKAK